MATIYVSPLGGGDGSGSSAANAIRIDSLNTAIQKAGAGGTVLMLADKGAYNISGSISISSGGTASAPVTVMGVSSSGTPMDITVNGTRDPNWSIGKADGNWVFKLYNGANNLVFDGIDFHNVGMGFQLGGDLQNVTLRNLEGYNVRYFIGNYVGGGASTASVSGLTVKDVEVHGFSKSVILLKYNTNNVVIDNVLGDSEYQDGDSFAMGVFLDGTVHDVLVKNTTMMNARGSNYSYWNGDGFTAERGVYNLRFENTLAKGNADGGYDLKSTNTVLVNAVAEDNNRNFRLWGDAELINPIGIDPRKQGGTSSQEQIWVSSGANVKVSGGFFSDMGSSTSVIDNNGSLTFSNTKFWHSGSLKIGSGSTGGLDMGLVTKLAATGSYSTLGEKYLPDGGYTAGYQTTSGDVVSPLPPPPPPPPPPPEGQTVTTFKQGASYQGTTDTRLAEAQPTATSWGEATSLGVDSGSGANVQTLLAFNNIFGTGAGQIPVGSTITSATLTVTTTNPSSGGGSLYRMLTGWSESSTWSSLGNGVQTNGVEAVASADANTGSVAKGANTFDVTASVNAWLSGATTADQANAANLGWLVNANNSDGWAFGSSESGTVPVLTVTYTPPSATTPPPPPPEPEPEPEPQPTPGFKSMTGTSGNDTMAPTTSDNWTIYGLDGNDTIKTLDGADFVRGDAGNDIISTGAGNDVLIGGLGADVLTGGSGADRFLYNSPSDSTVEAPDRITDFQVGVDKIDLSAIDAIARSRTDKAFKFIGESAFSRAGDLRIDKSDPTKTVVQGDVDGDGIADFAIVLDGNLNLSSGDFIL